MQGSTVLWNSLRLAILTLKIIYVEMVWTGHQILMELLRDSPICVVVILN